jgi:hypothetical protein
VIQSLSIDADISGLKSDQNIDGVEESDLDIDGDGGVIPKLRAYGPEMLLDDKDQESMSELAHSLKNAIFTWGQNKKQKKPQSNDMFRCLGFKNVTEARAALQLLGRKGRPVWSSAYFRQNMPYIRTILASTIVLLPPAHMLLHGLMKTFLVHSFGNSGSGWKTKDACPEKPFIFSSAAIKQFQVRCISH